MYSTFARWVVILVIGVSALAAVPARAATNDPVSQIKSFYGVLLESMKHADELGIEGRYKKLKPVIEDTFDLRKMTSIAVGPSWSRIPPKQQDALVDAFEHYTVATYASNFDSYDGERFEVDPNVEVRGPRRIVHTDYIRPGEDPIGIGYLMHDAGGAWKVIDVYYGGTISQLAARRSEFSSILRDGGVDALVHKLRDLGDKLMTGEG